ncbi:MAG: hypothetical protein RL173_409 [Fibrobacterota bacterium]|jgi:hypothetical protein
MRRETLPGAGGYPLSINGFAFGPIAAFDRFCCRAATGCYPTLRVGPCLLGLAGSWPWRVTPPCAGCLRRDLSFQTCVWAFDSQGPLSPLPLWTPSAPKGQCGPFGFPHPRGPLLSVRQLVFSPIRLARRMAGLADLHERAPLRNPRTISGGSRRETPRRPTGAGRVSFAYTG